MVFVLQPKPILLAELKPVAPSLLSDPAFSTDPSAHPYAVTSHEPWLSFPPAGHPTLKSKYRKRRPADSTASDSEPFHIIPPPNSPVNFADGPQNSTTFAVPNDVLDSVDVGAPSRAPHDQSSSSLTTAAETAVSKSHQEYLSPSPPPTTRPPATHKRRISLMTLLKRRYSQQPQSSASVIPKPRKALTLTRSVPNKSDVTHKPISDMRPNLMNIESQLLPPRPITLGSSTPATGPMPSTGHPTPKRPATDVPTNRHENLDRIDELDETNPWGVALHHGGPYEAAVQAIRGKEQIVFPGRGSYKQGILQTHDNNYFPPQATGLSLNLSPGQILPRNYHPHHSPPSQPVQNSVLHPPTAVMMKPPPAKTTHPQPQPSRVVPSVQSSATLPSRRQSYQATPSRDFQTRRQSSNPTSTVSQVNLNTSPLSSSSTIVPQQHQPHIPVAPVTNPQPSPNPLPVETHPNLPNRVIDESPMISIGIGMAMLGDESDEEEASEESSSSSHSQPSTSPDGGRHTRPIGLPSNPAILRKTSPEWIQPENLTTPQEGTSSLVSQPRKTTLEEMLDLPPESPPPYTSPVQPVGFGHFVPSQPSSTSSIQGLGPSVPRRGAPMQNSQQAFVATQAPPRASSVRNQPAFRSNVPRGYPPSRNSPERAGFEDTHSVHPSLSSKSSSSRSSGPPSSRRVPKHLVMPAPLAQSSVGPPQYQNRPPLAQLPPQRPVRHSLPCSAPLPVLAPLSGEPVPSSQIFVKAQAQEIHFAPSKISKLQKKVSLIGTSHPPVVTTVSFAPPMIGFNHSVAQEDDFRHMVTEQLVHKRVLSKRKNW